MLYRFVQAVHMNYALAVAWMYILAFAAALPLIFIFGQLVLAIFFFSLASLAVTVSVGWGIGMLSRALARHALSRGHCPRCGTGGQQPFDPLRAWTCESCFAEFEIGGAEVDEVERARHVETLEDDDERLLAPIFTAADDEAWDRTRPSAS